MRGMCLQSVDEAKKQLQECKDALAHENETYEISAQISDTQIKLWESQAAGQENNILIATEQENERYDKQLHEYRVQKINEQMALYQQERLRQPTVVLSLTLRS